MRTHRYQHASSRARHQLVVLGLVAVLLAALVTLLSVAAGVFTVDHDEAGNAPPTSNLPTRQPEANPDTGLPIGAYSHRGRPVGFPRSELGAVAVVVERNRAQIGLDPDTAREVIGVYADPADQTFFDQLAVSAVDQRRKIVGLPAASIGVGEVMAPVAYAQTPVGYQVEEYGPDYYLVSVINEVTTTTASGEVGRSLYVGQQFVAWTGEDWKLVEPSAGDLERLLATPPPAAVSLGNPEFDRAGWTALFDQPTGQPSK